MFSSPSDSKQWIELPTHNDSNDNQNIQHNASHEIPLKEDEIDFNPQAMVDCDDYCIDYNSISIRFCNKYMMIRLCLSILTLLLLIICAIYSFGQINQIYLKDFICPHRSLQEIHQHSKSLNLTKGTTDGCWLSKGIKINNDILFSKSNQPYDSELVFNASNVTKSMLFAILAVIINIGFVYFYVIQFIVDVIRYCNGYFIKIAVANINSANDAELIGGNSKTYCCFTLCMKRIYKYFQSIYRTDSCLWLNDLIIKEIFEIMLQTFVCLQYGGVQFNATNIVLSEQRELILLFASIISINAILTGIIWILYVFKNNCFHGIHFQYCLFLIDTIFDLFYALFPLIILSWNHIASNTTNTSYIEIIKTGAGTLYSNTWLTFFSAFIPILLLTKRVCWNIKEIISSYRQTIENQVYQCIVPNYRKVSTFNGRRAAQEAVNSFSSNGKSHKKHHILYGELETDIDQYINDGCCFCIICDGEKMLDQNFSLQSIKQIDKNDFDEKIIRSLEKYKRQQLMRRCYLVFIAICLILFGIIFIGFCMIHFYILSNICDNPSKSELANHLELLSWNNCSYKTYPFTFIVYDDNFNDIPCQCRSLRLDLNMDHNGKINEHVIHHIFSHFYQLEAIQILGSTQRDININFTSNLFKAEKLRAIDLDSFYINYISDDIVKWSSNLEYLKLSNCHIYELPSYSSMSSLTKIKYINLEYNYITDEIKWICSMKQVQYVILIANSISIPSCLWSEGGNNNNLKVLDISLVRKSFNYHMLEMDLDELIAFSISMDETDFPSSNVSNGTFNYSLTTKYYMFSFPFCSPDFFNKIATEGIKQFILETNLCDRVCYGYDDDNKYLEYTICPYANYQNGICDEDCNIFKCQYDGSDCNQLCDNKDECMYSNYTNLFGNNQCDEECNNFQCGYDFGECNILDNRSYAEIDNYTLCEETTYCDLSINDNWINDGFCDDQCNIEYCDFDGTDCRSCQDAEYCQKYTSIALNVIGTDYVINQQEGCKIFNALQSQIDDYWKKGVSNCSIAMQFLDVDKNGYLNAFEIIRGGEILTHHSDFVKSSQLNCSLCFSSLNAYYGGWNISQIEKYTDTDYLLSFDLSKYHQ